MLTTVLRECCQIYTKLPSAATSTIDGVHCFRRSGANVITICPRLCDGTLAAYICSGDVQLIVRDAAHRPLRVQVQLIKNSDGNIALRYALDDVRSQLTLTMELCVRACGVTLVDTCVRAAPFDARTAGRLCGQHVLTDAAFRIAIHPAGTHLVASNPLWDTLSVYELPDMKLSATLGSCGSGPGEFNSIGDMCFTDVGTLLVVDFGNNRVQHWTLGGSSIATLAIKSPHCVASRGTTIVVGTASGMRFPLLERRDWGRQLRILQTHSIAAVAFANSVTLAISISDLKTVGLYTMRGELLKQLSVDISSNSLVTCADGCLLVSDFSKGRIRVFAPDGAELTSSPFAAHTFRPNPVSIALRGEHVYVLEITLNPMKLLERKLLVFE